MEYIDFRIPLGIEVNSSSDTRIVYFKIFYQNLCNNNSPLNHQSSLSSHDQQATIFNSFSFSYDTYF